MKSIANQYRDLKEGRMSQANFMRNLRMSMPQYITNVTSFNDSIRILKNKGILTESGHGDAPISQMSRKDMIDFLGTTEEKAKDMSDEELRDAVVDKNEDIKEGSGNSLLDELESEMENGNSYAEAISAVAAKHNMNEDELATKYPEQSVGDKMYKDDYMYEADKDKDDDEVEDMIAKAEEEESGKYTKFQDVPGAISEEYDFPRGAEAMAELIARKYGSELKQLPSREKEKMALSHAYETILKSGHPKAKVIAKNVVWGYADEDWPMDFISTLNDILGRDNLKEGKGKDLHPNQINPDELRMGIKVELEHTDDLDKAKKIALDHLAENPYYYTALKLSGIESPSVFTAKAPVKKGKKKETIQLVDLANQMKKVKVVKEVLKEEEQPRPDSPSVKRVFDLIQKNPSLNTEFDRLDTEQEIYEFLVKFFGELLDPINATQYEKIRAFSRAIADIRKQEKTTQSSTVGPKVAKATFGAPQQQALSKAFQKGDFKEALKEMIRQELENSKKKVKEARYNIAGDPNAAAKQAMEFVNSTLKVLSDDIEIQQSQDDAILRYDYWKPLPPEAVEKLKLSFDVERLDDYDEDTGNLIAYRLTLKQDQTNEYYDGRDNLIDDIAATEK